MKKEKLQFAKKVVVSTTIIFILSIISALIWSWLDKSTDVFMYIIPSTGGVWGASIIWYMKKSQLENGIKIQLGMIRELLKIRSEFNTNNEEEYIDEIREKTEYRMQEKVDEFIDDALTPPEIQNY